jgi:hypothetical protein
MVADLAAVEPTSLAMWLGRLEDAARTQDEATIRQLLSIVAGYRPNPEAGEVPRIPAAVSTDEQQQDVG